MAKERGVLQMIYKNFIASLRPRILDRKLIGEDFYGTKYYEESLPSYSSKKRPPRYFVPVDKDNFEQEVPAEWEAWLRYRRKDPPTNEEVEENYRISLMKKKNAQELESSRTGDGTEVPPQLASKNQQSFPVYEEYKEYGQKYVPKPE